MILPEGLNPGIRRTVGWLRAHGFNTTDSGDGVTNVEAGMEGALTYPHVFCVTDRAHMLDEADRLYVLVSVAPGATIEASYSPGGELCVIALYNIKDSDLPEVLP